MTIVSESAILLAGLGSLLVTAMGVGAFRRWSAGRGLLDVPNHRSSHTVPVPRGGGIVIALCVTLAYVLAANALSVDVSAGYLIGALLVTLISWLDDVYSVPFPIRLSVHLAAAAALVYDTGSFQSIAIPLYGLVTLPLTAGVFLAVMAVAYFINAFNFMDGIDGIAGSQAVVASLGWLLLGLHFGSDSLSLLAGAVLGSSLGFLLHNWPPARVFMGDAGSAFLGFTLAAFPFTALKEGKADVGILPLVAVAFVWMFVFDSVLTILRRLLRGERIWVAHRSHLYQRMVIYGRPHLTVTLIYLGFALTVMAAGVAYAIRADAAVSLVLPLIMIASGALLMTITAISGATAHKG